MKKFLTEEEMIYLLSVHDPLTFKLIFICNILCKYIDGAKGVKFGTFHLSNRACFLGSVYKNLALCGIIDAFLLLQCYIFQSVS